MVKIVRFGVIVLNDDRNSFEHVIEVFQNLFNWDSTQAANCANIIHNKGEYVVKWYDSEKAALYTAQMIRKGGLSTKILIDRNATP